VRNCEGWAITPFLVQYGRTGRMPLLACVVRSRWSSRKPGAQTKVPAPEYSPGTSHPDFLFTDRVDKTV
jgi:hypothetical protein